MLSDAGPTVRMPTARLSLSLPGILGSQVSMEEEPYYYSSSPVYYYTSAESLVSPCDADWRMQVIHLGDDHGGTQKRRESEEGKVNVAIVMGH